MSRDEIFSTGRGFFSPIVWSDSINARAIADKCSQIAESTGRVVFPNLHFYIPWINDIVNSRPLIEYSREVLGDDIAVENTFLVFKKPGDIFEVPLHQDGIDDNLDLDPDNSFSFWLSITDSNRENGGLIVYPNSHSDGYIEYSLEKDHSIAGGGTPIGIKTDVKYSEELIQLEAGEAVVMNSALMHKSGLNVTDLPRIGLNVRITNQKGVRKRIGNTEPIYALGGDWGQQAFSGVLEFANPLEDFRSRIYRTNNGGKV